MRLVQDPAPRIARSDAETDPLPGAREVRAVGVWGNCASVTPFAECESVCLVTVAADPTSSAGSVAALPLGRSDRR